MKKREMKRGNFIYQQLQLRTRADRLLLLFLLTYRFKDYGE